MMEKGQDMRDVCQIIQRHTREHSGINGLTPSEMFLQKTFNKSHNSNMKLSRKVSPM